MKGYIWPLTPPVKSIQANQFFQTLILGSYLCTKRSGERGQYLALIQVQDDLTSGANRVAVIDCLHLTVPGETQFQLPLIAIQLYRELAYLVF